MKALLLSGSAGPDLLHGYDGSDDVLDGGAGSDELRGGSGSDTYLFGLGSGQDAIIDQSGSNDSIVFGPLIAPQMLRFARDDGNLLITLDGFSDNLAIAGAFSTPAGQVEEFHFSDGSVLHFDDILNSMISQSSTPLDDVVTGFARRDDFLESSTGDDVLRGASGSDTYVFEAGHGRDIVDDLAGAADTILVQGYTSQEVTISRLDPDKDDVRLSFAGGTDEITIIGGLATGGGAIEKIIFADGKTLTPAQLQERVLTDAANAGDDVITGFSESDVLAGGTGDDILSGGDGGDIYHFARGDGFDVIGDNGVGGVDRLVISGFGLDDLRVARISPEAHDLVLSFRETDDRILIRNGLDETGSDVIEEITFGDGTLLSHAQLLARLDIGTATEANDTLIGGSASEVLAGGRGDDVLEGRDGSDFYVFRRGDGFDMIEDNGAGDTDHLRIEGFLSSEVHIERETPGSATLLLTFPGTTDTIRIKNSLDGDRADGIEEISFDDGIVWSMSDIRERLLTEAVDTDGAFIDGFRGNDRLQGGPGPDRLTGRDGADIYLFERGGGRDVIEDDGLFDTDRVEIKGYAADELRLSRVADTDTLVIRFQNTDDELIIRNTLGSDIRDTVERLHFDDGTVWTMDDVRARLDDAGADELLGGQGGDVFIFTRGDGRDTVRDNGVSGVDVVEIKGYAPGDVSLLRLGTMLVLTFDGTDDALQFPGALGDFALNVIEEFRFDDGTVWSQEDIKQRLLSQAATDGADVIEGFGGADVLAVGQGDDWLAGGTGGDTYLYTRGDGHDTIKEKGTGAPDRLQISGYAPQDARLLQTDAHLQIRFDGGDVLTLLDILGSGSLNVVEEIAFDDGTVWTLPEIRQKLLLDAATSGNDILRGFDSDDLLAGGRGDDHLSGGNGQDDYIFSRGDGQDIISDGGSLEADRLVFKGYTSDDLILRRLHPQSDDLLIRFAGTTDSVLLTNVLNPDALGRVEEIVFDDGTVLNISELGDRLADGSASEGDDTVTGTDFAETLGGRARG